MSRFLSPRFSALEEYIPGEQPRGFDYVKLNTNESPFPPSPLVISRINDAEVSNLKLYPDPECKELREKLADYYGFERENIVLGNGSDEILSMAFMAFCDSSTGCVFPNISYGFYKVYADLYGVDYTEIPLKEDFSINAADYFATGRNVVIANPNAPTGMSLSSEKIEEIIKTNPDRVVLIDEAYVDFGGKSVVELVHKYDNLLVVRTFSKSRSLAGARLGFGIASKEIIADLEKIRFSNNPYNINRLTLTAGIASVEDDTYFKGNIQKIINTRSRTAENLKKRGFTVLDSDANFVFAKHGCMGGRELYMELKARGVLVRHFDKPLIGDYLRITIGTDDQMEKLIGALDDILKTEGML